MYYVAWPAGTSNRAVVLARQAWNRFLGSLKELQIRAQSLYSVHCTLYTVQILVYIYLVILMCCRARTWSCRVAITGHITFRHTRPTTASPQAGSTGHSSLSVRNINKIKINHLTPRKKFSLLMKNIARVNWVSTELSTTFDIHQNSIMFFYHMDLSRVL